MRIELIPVLSVALQVSLSAECEREREKVRVVETRLRAAFFVPKKLTPVRSRWRLCSCSLPREDPVLASRLANIRFERNNVYSLVAHTS